jgi:hypothetical protein
VHMLQYVVQLCAHVPACAVTVRFKAVGGAVELPAERMKLKVRCSTGFKSLVECNPKLYYYTRITTVLALCTWH